MALILLLLLLAPIAAVAWLKPEATTRSWFGVLLMAWTVIAWGVVLWAFEQIPFV